MSLLNNDWIFPKEFIEDDNSIRLLIHDGNKITIAKEYLYRSKTVWFIKDLSNVLRKNYRAKKEDDLDHDIRMMKVFWTAAVFFHRFFLFHSFQHDRFDVAVACLFLAGKVEEKFLRLRDHVAMCFKLRKGHYPSEEERQEKEKHVLQAERILLNTLNFDLNVTHPFSFFKNIIGKELKPYFADSDASKRVLRLATTLATDSMESTLCLLYTPKQLAYGLVFMSVTLLSLQPTTNNSNTITNYNIITNSNWLEIFEKDIDEDVLQDICFRLIGIFKDKTTIDEVIIINNNNTDRYKTNINDNLHIMKNNRVSRASSQTGMTDSPASSQSLSPNNSNYPNEESKSNVVIDNKLTGLKRKDNESSTCDNTAKQMRTADASEDFPTNTTSDNTTPALPLLQRLTSDDAPPPPPPPSLPLQPSSQPQSLPLQANGQLHSNDTPFSVTNTPSFDSVARPGRMIFPS